MNLSTIVALLTLIGYSVNDKVVVYDRIREHLAGGSDEPLADVIDRSLNQALARCILTSGTTLAGVTIATASSLFVAGLVVAWLAQRSKGAPAPDALGNRV